MTSSKSYCDEMSEKSAKTESFEVDTSPEYSEVELLMPKQSVKSQVSLYKTSSTASSSSRGVSRLSVVCTATCLFAVAAAAFIVYGRFVVHDNYAQPHDIFQNRMEFRGTDGLDAVQHLSTSVTQNYVIYHVIKPDERIWIVDDFAAGVQVMKVETDDEVVCYVTSLNKSLSVSQPQDYIDSSPRQGLSGGMRGERRVQTVFMASEALSAGEVDNIGSHAVDLCSNTPVYWVTPVAVNTQSSGLLESGVLRSKRNVKKCIESCCYLVCCCNQKFLQWQTDHSLNCNHVCTGCTPRSLTSIREIC